MNFQNQGASFQVTDFSAQILMRSTFAVALPASANDQVFPSLELTNVYLLTPLAGGSTVTGIVKPAGGHAQLLLVWNVSATDRVTITHNDVRSTAGNRVLLGGNVSLVLPPNAGAWFWYDPTTLAWRATP